jgi:hypothetical protein
MLRLTGCAERHSPFAGGVRVFSSLPIPLFTFDIESRRTDFPETCDFMFRLTDGAAKTATHMEVEP